MAFEIAIDSINEEEFKFSAHDMKSIERKHLSFGLHLSFNVDADKNLFKVRFTVIYNYDLGNRTLELMRFVNSTNFKVKGLNKIVKFEKANVGKFQFPDDLMITFVGASVSSARGMLAYKLSGTVLSKYYLPLIDVKKLLEESYVS
jgi:hypothetical protein